MSEDITFVSDAYLVSQTSKYDTYLLPNGATVVVDRVSKKLIRIINRLHDEKSEDYSGGIYDLSNMKVETDSNGNLTITINESGNTFNQKITFRNGTAYMEIGQNGATTSGRRTWLAASEWNRCFLQAGIPGRKNKYSCQWYTDHGDKRRTLDSS